MLTSRFETEDTDVRITTYNGAKITAYRKSAGNARSAA
jgi:hypothetical protein